MLLLEPLASGTQMPQQASRQLLPLKVLLSSGWPQAQEPRSRAAATLQTQVLGQLMTMMLDWQQERCPRLRQRRRCWACLEKVLHPGYCFKLDSSHLHNALSTQHQFSKCCRDAYGTQTAWSCKHSQLKCCLTCWGSLGCNAGFSHACARPLSVHVWFVLCRHTERSPEQQLERKAKQHGGVATAGARQKGKLGGHKLCLNTRPFISARLE